MIKPHYQTTLSLAGGVGNQLFQLAAGIALANDERINVEHSLANPSKDSFGVLEIENYLWPSSVKFLPERRCGWLEKKLGNYLLRLSSISFKKNASFFRVDLQSKVASNVLSVLYWNGFKVQVCKGVGFDGTLTSDRSLLIGYFQTNKWVESAKVTPIYKDLRLKIEPEWLKKLGSLANVEKPLVLHIRLGDYKTEKLFGIPTRKYFESALRELWETNKYRKIWLFSDEPDAAIRDLPLWVVRNTRVIIEGKDSPAATLEAMRLGYGYVISNSTFGWWGAYLSHNKNAPVIAPNPWFKSKEEPLRIIPENWIRKDAWE